MRARLELLACGLIVGVLGASTASAALLGTGFTYQGQLNQSGSPVAGTKHFRFSLWDAAAGGSQVGTNQIVPNVLVSAGILTVQLNGAGEFGASAFDGDARWLQVEVCTDGACGTTTVLNPRQILSGTPYALEAVQAKNLVRLTGGVGIQINSGSATNTPGIFAKTQDAHDLLLGSFLDGGYAHGFISTGYTNYARKTSIGRRSSNDLNTSVFEPLFTVVSNTGNVGIGTATPEYPLSFPSNAGDKIALTAGASHFGLGVANSTLQIHTANAISGIGFGHGSSSSFTENVRIAGDGRVGIGTSLPSAKLDVRGDIRLGSSGQYFSASGSENLAIIRGSINGCASGTIQYGSGFTLEPGCALPEYIRTITFNTPFLSPPTVTATSTDVGGFTTFCEIVSVSTTEVRIVEYYRHDGGYSGGPLHFIAIGPR